jgi:hypothetical protein
MEVPKIHATVVASRCQVPVIWRPPQTYEQQLLIVTKTDDKIQIAQYIVKYTFKPSTGTVILHVRFE